MADPFSESRLSLSPASGHAAFGTPIQSHPDDWTLHWALPGPLIALLTAAAYYLGSQVGFLFTPKDSPIALFWPPNAILLGILLLTSRRKWPLLFLAVLAVHLVIQLRVGIPLLPAVGWYFSNVSEAAIAALCIQFFYKERSLFDRVPGVVVFVAFGIGVATLLTSFLDAANTVGSGLASTFWDIWAHRLCSNALADITVVPIVLFVGLKGPYVQRLLTRERCVELLLLLLAVATVSFAIFGQPQSAHSRTVFMFAPVPFFVWAAMRFGAAGLSSSILVVALISLWNAMHGRGPLVASPLPDQALDLQVFLTLSGLPLLVLAAMVTERQSAAEKERSVRSLLMHASEQERRRVARELHDDIVQQLSLVGSNVDELREKPGLPASPVFDEIQSQISSITAATRRISHDLHPYAVDYLGLVDAIRELCTAFQRQTGVSANFLADVETKPPTAAAYALYRIAREALQSVSEGEKPRKLSLQLRQSGEGIRLWIEVEGADLEKRTALALPFMREQMFLAHGTLAATRRLPEGLEILATVPPGTFRE